jgi:hypothetical protein
VAAFRDARLAWERQGWARSRHRHAEATGSVQPKALVAGLRQYLGRQPHDDVAGALSRLEACASVQVPQGGVTKDHGECPAVSAAIRGRAAKTGALEAEVARLKAPAEKPAE